MTPQHVQDRHRSFDRLYRRHHAEIYRAALRATGDRDEAEEVTQSAFLAAYRAWIGGDLPREPRAWLFAIAENTRRRRYMARLRRPETAGLDEATERAAGEGPTVREIRAALLELPERQRAAVVLREIGGCSYMEIAAELDLTVASVQMLLFRARRTLRSRLAPTGPVVVLPGWLAGWTSWLGGGGAAAPAVRAAGAAGALVLGLGISAGDAPRAAAEHAAPPSRAAAIKPAPTAQAARKSTPVAQRPAATGGQALIARAGSAPATPAASAPAPRARPHNNDEPAVATESVPPPPDEPTPKPPAAAPTSAGAEEPAAEQQPAPTLSTVSTPELVLQLPLDDVQLPVVELPALEIAGIEVAPLETSELPSEVTVPAVTVPLPPLPLPLPIVPDLLG